jgi:hypothetical protein
MRPQDFEKLQAQLATIFQGPKRKFNWFLPAWIICIINGLFSLFVLVTFMGALGWFVAAFWGFVLWRF